MKYLYNYLWDKGPLYQVNEDSLAVYYVTIENKELIFAILADGVGSLYHGEIISGIVVERIKNYCLDKGLKYFRDNNIIYFKRGLVREIYDIDKWFYDIGINEKIEMGTTISFVIIYNNKLLFTSIGDSPIAIVQKDKFKFISKPDIDDNKRLLRYIGCGKITKLKIHEKRLPKSIKAVIIGSDGFFNRMSNSMKASFSLAKVRKALLEEICKKLRKDGEKDNISCVEIWLE